MGPSRWRTPEGHVTSIHSASGESPRPNRSRRSGWAMKPLPPERIRVWTPRGVFTRNLGSEGILAALRTLQLDTDEALVLAHVVPEQEMSLALDGGEKDVQVAVVVQVDRDGRTSIGDGVDARNP